MELRGLGVINVKDLFGVASTRASKRVELVVQLERWEPGREYERLGLDDEFHEILGLKLPLIRMPVAPGRNVAILVEVAARNQLLRSRGHHAARALAERLDRTLRDASLPSTRRTTTTRAWRAAVKTKARRAGRARKTGGAGNPAHPASPSRGPIDWPPEGGTAGKSSQPFIVLTGLSGSGKSQAIRALEDLGYFCVDNLPTTLIPTLAACRCGATATSRGWPSSWTSVRAISSRRSRGSSVGCGRCPG